MSRAAICTLLLLVTAASAQAGTIAVRGDIVHTMAGPPIADGVVLVRDGKIVAVGPAARTRIPDGVETLRAAVVVPGLVDAHSVVGLSGMLNQPQDQDQLERTEPLQPELRAVDAYNARDELVDWVRSFGVTTIHTGHAPGQLIAGQTLVAKTRGGTVDDAVIVREAMVAATLGEGALTQDKGKPPGTRSKAVALLRQALIAAGEYRVKMSREDEAKRPARNLRSETLGRVLAGELPLLVTVARHNDIVAALRVGQEFGVRIVLEGAAEAYLVLDEIRAAGVGVIAHPPMQRAVGETEHATMELAARLDAAGIPFALQSGYESYVPKTRVVLFEAALAAAHGLPRERALAAVTIDAARLVGVADRVGSLEPGKDGDLALYDGDPFEYTTHCTDVVIEGERFPGEAR